MAGVQQPDSWKAAGDKPCAPACQPVVVSEQVSLGVGEACRFLPSVPGRIDRVTLLAGLVRGLGSGDVLLRRSCRAHAAGWALALCR